MSQYEEAIETMREKLRQELKQRPRRKIRIAALIATIRQMKQLQNRAGA